MNTKLIIKQSDGRVITVEGNPKDYAITGHGQDDVTFEYIDGRFYDQLDESLKDLAYIRFIYKDMNTLERRVKRIICLSIIQILLSCMMILLSLF